MIYLINACFLIMVSLHIDLRVKGGPAGIISVLMLIALNVWGLTQ
jgi:hypothetical protein